MTVGTKQDKISRAIFFSFLFKVGMVTFQQYLAFCHKLLSIAQESKGEENKLFIIGLIAYSLESCSGELIMNFKTLKFIAEYSLFVMDREYVNMMLELQIIDVIHGKLPDMNFGTIMKHKQKFRDAILEAERMKDSVGEAKAFAWLKEKVEMREGESKKIPAIKKRLIISKPEFETSAAQEQVKKEEKEEKNSAENDGPEEDQVEKSLLKTQFDKELEALLAEGTEGFDQSQKKHVVFKQMLNNKNQTASETGFRLIVKNQKSRLVSKTLTIPPATFDSRRLSSDD